MQQIEQLSELGEPEQKRVDKVVDSSTMTTRGEDVAEIAHDACNMVTALDLYCDLLQEPGVLGVPFAHYGGELRLVAAASRRLVDKLMSSRAPNLATKPIKANDATSDPFLSPEKTPRQWKNIPAEPISNLAEELLANRSLLAALAGPTICLTLDVQGGAARTHDRRRPYPDPGEPCKECRRSHVGRRQDSHHAVGKLRRARKQPLADPECGRQRTRTARKFLERIFEPRNRDRRRRMR